MGKRRISAAAFNHFPARARELARDHDVVVESHGRPASVIVAWPRYVQLTEDARTPLEAIADSAAAAIEFDIPRFADRPRTARV
jgi:hypothetical protein